MREGAETIVFFQALTNGATETVERHAVMAGIVAAAIVLAATFVVIQRAADRIPMRLFFHVTSFMLYALAIVFVGQGVASLQEASVVPATFVNYAPTIPMLGIFPTIQSLGAQAVLLMLALAARVRSAQRGRAQRQGCGASGDAAGAPGLMRGRLRDRIVVAAEQHALHVGTQLLGYHQRAKSHPRALIDHRIARDRTLTRRASA